MRNLIVLIALLPLLAGCANTRAANAALELDLRAEQAAYVELLQAQIHGTEAELEQAIEDHEDAIAEVRESAAEQAEAFEQDLEEGLKDIPTIVRTGAGALGLGPWADLAAALAGAFVVGRGTYTKVMKDRDQRKMMGMDPLQRVDVPTPPVQNSSAE